ncbi:MAG: cell division protein FtsL [Schwartzia sp.]|jgi:cell division protein FtsL|nr:cell division protein FtsL [Schwartzia sp. (in: firmicutes)]MDY6294742.1 cell division protein FtsL [Schwartzia succinivorans]MBQ1917679.1 cell division protein FtsL [Schwartzia sp. (in: firmicutes)]MBQ2047769.1 cell division protein FtsL [Schwartzia sp. (in: firmicutes)]MBQ3864043.1 cell division protein FtsL [Schwartzia sp. (in: firmicutes)]
MPARQLREDYYYEEQPAKVVQPAPKRALRERPHINTNLRFRVGVLAVALTLTASITVARTVINATRGYELVQTQNQAAQLERENKQLELQIAEMRSPERIKNIATNDLGMSVPRDVYFAAEK